MATLTVRNIPAELVDRLRETARRNGHSMEQEVRDLLESRYGSRSSILARVRSRWAELPEVSAEEVERWRGEGRS